MASELRHCPFCSKTMMLRSALWPSEGDADAIIHADPTDCPMLGFSDGSADGSIIEKWNCSLSNEDDLPSDGSCVRCGSVPRNANGLCNTCLDEDAEHLENTRPTPVAPVSPDASFIEAARWHEAEAERKRSVAVKSKRLEAQIATHEASAAHFRSAVPVSPDATGKCGELETVAWRYRDTWEGGHKYWKFFERHLDLEDAEFQALCLRSQAVELLAAEREKSLFFKTAMETALTFCGLKDKTIASLEADNAAMTARVKADELKILKLEERLSAEQASHEQSGKSRDEWRGKAEYLEAKLAAAEQTARAAHETLIEINPSNYNHDDVCQLNDASVEAIFLLADILGETHGKTKEWWDERRAVLGGTL